MIKLYQHLRTTNDTYGNPRRLFMVYEIRSGDAVLTEVIDEGYSGIPTKLIGYTELHPAEITPRAYRDWKREGERMAKGAK